MAPTYTSRGAALDRHDFKHDPEIPMKMKHFSCGVPHTNLWTRGVSEKGRNDTTATLKENLSKKTFVDLRSWVQFKFN